MSDTAEMDALRALVLAQQRELEQRRKESYICEANDSGVYLYALNGARRHEICCIPYMYLGSVKPDYKTPSIRFDSFSNSWLLRTDEKNNAFSRIYQKGTDDFDICTYCCHDFDSLSDAPVSSCALKTLLETLLPIETLRAKGFGFLFPNAQ